MQFGCKMCLQLGICLIYSPFLKFSMQITHSVTLNSLTSLLFFWKLFMLISCLYFSSKAKWACRFCLSRYSLFGAKRLAKLNSGGGSLGLAYYASCICLCLTSLILMIIANIVISTQKEKMLEKIIVIVPTLIPKYDTDPEPAAICEIKIMKVFFYLGVRFLL